MPLKFSNHLKAMWELIRETLTEWFKDNASVQGAALAFYTLFSLAPLLIIMTVVVGYFLGQKAVQEDLLAQLVQLCRPGKRPQYYHGHPKHL